MRSLQQFWSVRRIGEDRVTLVRLGPLRLWLARAEKEWGLAFERGEANGVRDIAQVPGDVVPEGLDWSNLLFHEAPREFCLRPTVPDRPVVVKPAHPVTIPRGESGQFFVQVPVFLQVMILSGRKEVELGTISTQTLSDTWFGIVTEGDLCYTVPIPAGMDFEELEPHAHHIVFPVEVENHSDERLVVEKLCLRTAYATLYSGVEHLWGSTVKIRHEGGFKGTTIHYSSEVPDYEKSLNEVSKPLKREERGLHRLTFSSAFQNDLIISK
ncbi:MAG: DUF432 domain-containing protein [Puniceicoccaceae bacterium]